MRRIVGTMAVVLLIAACGTGSGAGDNGQEIHVSLYEYSFDPAEIHLTVGQPVTLVLQNDGGKDHELMAGREVHEEDGIPHGFEQDFFDTVDDLNIDPPDALETSMEGMGEGDMSGTTMGDMSSTTMGDEEMEDMGVMVAREPGEMATVTFTPTEDSVGEWQIGCFEEEGTHWQQGMKGTIIVEEG
ncbi:MAG: hypothetical protein WB239_14290 [Acidimicrobiia bacterium]